MTNTDALTGKLLDIINQVQNAVTAHSSDAINLMLTSVRVDGICWLLLSFINLVISSVIFRFSCEKYKLTQDGEGCDAAALIASCSIIMFVLILIYPWNWIHAINPKLYLAHEIIIKVMS